MGPEINKLYGDKIRVRACGLCWQGDHLLMVNHAGLTPGDFWAPPGGGLEFGESVERCLQKEFLEETGFKVSLVQFRFACEYVRRPLHAIELFFDVRVAGGSLAKGEDPELPIIQAVKFMAPAEIGSVPSAYLHGIFRCIPSPEHLKTLNGFFTI